ncbi:MAG TPA: CHAP domain-containing protein [Candidatus Acidoferrales bacterium]|nr:CHAP domain-containing protein [Candidatus Acidoferrales bacterium]
MRVAKKYNDSSAWAFSKRKDNFPPGTDKCNKYVYDVAKEAGAEALTKGSDGNMRPPLAGEWASPDVKIPNWEVLAGKDVPQPGDVAAYPLPGHPTYTGHSGIVTSVDADGTVHAIAAHEDVVGPDDKFNRADGRMVTYRRFTGGR